MTESEILDCLTTIFRSAFDDDRLALTPETTPKDIEKWDSHRYIDIILRVEEQLGIRIRAREANKAKTVGDLISVIQEKFFL